MRYVCTRRYRGLDLNGKFINLPYASALKVEGRYITTLDNRPLAFVKSETAHKYFAIDDDGDGLKRGEITHKIAYSNRKTSEGYRYTSKEREVLCEKWAKYIRQDVEMLLFNHEFFCAPLSDLKQMQKDIKALEE